MRKPVFGVSDLVRHKPVCAVTVFHVGISLATIKCIAETDQTGQIHLMQLPFCCFCHVVAKVKDHSIFLALFPRL